jgi:hypothetical protein
VVGKGKLEPVQNSKCSCQANFVFIFCANEITSFVGPKEMDVSGWSMRREAHANLQVCKKEKADKFANSKLRKSNYLV